MSLCVAYLIIKDLCHISLVCSILENKGPVSYLYQTVSLGVKELEDLLEVLHLVFSESLVLPRHIH